MQLELTELLTTLESLTAEAQETCAADMARARALVEERGLLLNRLIEHLKQPNVIAESEMERIRGIERSGDKLLASIQNDREQLRSAVSTHARQRAFAGCVTGILNEPPPPHTFDL